MKYILSIFFIILLTGCHISTGRTAKKVGASCTSICLQAAKIRVAQRTQTEAADAPASKASLTEKTASILVW